MSARVKKNSPESAPAWLAEDIKNLPPGAPGPATREVMAAAGYSAAVIADFSPELEQTIHEQLHGSPTWPAPNDATPDELPLAVAFETVRARRGAELVAARPVVAKVKSARIAHVRVAANARTKYSEQAAARAESLREFQRVKGFRSAAELRRSLERRLKPEDAMEALLVSACIGLDADGSPRLTPSLKTINRAVRFPK